MQPTIYLQKQPLLFFPSVVPSLAAAAVEDKPTPNPGHKNYIMILISHASDQKLLCNYDVFFNFLTSLQPLKQHFPLGIIKISCLENKREKIIQRRGQDIRLYFSFTAQPNLVHSFVSNHITIKPSATPYDLKVQLLQMLPDLRILTSSMLT